MVLFYVSIDLSLNLLLCFREIVTKFDALENSVADPDPGSNKCPNESGSGLKKKNYTNTI